MKALLMRLAPQIYLALTLAACGGSNSVTPPNATSDIAADSAALVILGDTLFNDSSLSSDGKVSCQSCHTSALSAFSDAPNRLSAGVNHSIATPNTTERNSPTLAYVGFIPALALAQADEGTAWVGGLFHDGRADNLASQIEGPLLGAKEMGNASKADVINKLCSSMDSKSAYLAAYGNDSLVAACAAPPNSSATDLAFTRLGRALAELQRAPAFQPFSSKYDAYLSGSARLSPQEIQGLSLFTRADKGNCAACHVINRSNAAKQPLFTDFTYDNIGLPSVAGDNADLGLFSTPKVGQDPALKGKFRVPTLRNVKVTPPYMHNGVFADLKTVVEFYNSRDIDSRWTSMGPTDFPATVNRSELGNLQLKDDEINAIVAFLDTLTDGYSAP